LTEFADGGSLERAGGVLNLSSRGMGMVTQEYRKNRAQFPQAELAKYQGSWVAFSADGRRIVARGETVEQLEREIAIQGESGQNVVREWVPGAEDDSLLGAEEWA
jgi:Family of unknown function (DUF5678)